MLNVTDLSAYLYCPRQFYLQKVKGIKQPSTKPMISGFLKHKVREIFANDEEKLLQNLELINHQLNNQKIKEFYENFLEQIIESVFNQNLKLIMDFKINIKELKVLIKESMKNEIELRARAIENTLKKGFTGKDLWKNLTPKYISELQLVSESLGLKGRADRVMFSEAEIIPFELKTRSIERIFESDEIQLTAYAMLLKEKYSKEIKKGILEAGNKLHEIEITEKNKEKVMSLISEINEILTKKSYPKFPPNFSKCQSCAFEEECESL